jgi:hypothetical protein
MARPEFDALSGYRPTVRVTGTPSNKARHKTLQNTRRIIIRLNSIACIGGATRIQPVCYDQPTLGDPRDAGCCNEN